MQSTTPSTERWARGRKAEICEMTPGGRHRRLTGDGECAECGRNLCGCGRWEELHVCSLMATIIAEREAEYIIHAAQ